MLVVASIPFIVLLATKKVAFFKKKPHLLYLAMAFPTMLLAYWLFSL
jgi:hypothetical protein